MIIAANAMLAVIEFAKVERTPIPMTGTALPQNTQTKLFETISARRFSGAITKRWPNRAGMGS
jgi:hypothetical protein